MALIFRIGFTLFDRWGANLGRLPYTAATHTEALDGTDELKITCDRELSKGQRIVWVDRQGMAHEHLVDEVSQVHDDGGKTYCEAVCINSIAELLDDYIEDKRPSGGVAEALTSILGGTRWEVGTCDLKGSATHTFYHTSVREGLTDLVATWGGELETRIETDGAKVTHRYIGVRASRGDQDSPKRFTWTKDIIDIKRTVGSANPKTRVYGYGKGVETDTGGYGRRLTFGDVNGGKDYVEDAEATKIWGHPDGKGGILPAVDTYINEQCEDAAQLLQETQDYLDTVKEPTVSYEANVLDLYAYGRAWEGVALGDCVAIIDKQFAESGIRLKGRVSQIERDLVTAETTVTFGNLVDALTDMWETVAGALKSGAASRANYDAVANPSVGWLTLLQSALNKQFNAVGTFKVESFELGQIFSNIALNPATGLPVKTTSGMWAVNINGMGIRLADSLNAQGEWDWATFVTGASVTADCINAGTMHADRVRAGLLTDEVGNNFWNLDTGELHMTGYAKDSETISSVDVEYAQNQSATTAPTSGWQTTAPAYKSGYYIWSRTKTIYVDLDTQPSYSTPVMISGRDGADGGKGDTGATGIGVSAIVEQYYLSTSKTSRAGGSWTETQPAYVSGRYYWTRSKVTWTDGKVTYATPVLAQGVNNANEEAEKANDAVTTLDEALDQEEVLNRLTNGSKEQGIYLENGKLYINGTYIKSGTLDAGLLKAGKLLVTNKTTGATVFCADVDAGTCYIGGDSVKIGGSTLTDKTSALESGQAALEAKYGVCSTAAATAAKTVSITGFVLKKGATVNVRFYYANSASSPTLNVNGTGAKSIAYAGSSYLNEKYYWKSGALLTFTYDGSYWQLADGGSRKDARSIWARDTSSVTVSTGTVTFDSNTFICNADNLKVSVAGVVTANSFNATGQFTGGSTSSGYGMRLGTDGSLRGYYNGSEMGRIDPSANVYYIPTGKTLYGMQLYGKQVLREVSPHVSALASSSTSATSTRCTTGSGSFIYNITYDESSGTTTWYYETLSFVNGRLTSNLLSR